MDDAIELAAQYLTDIDCSVKIVMFAMGIETTEEIAGWLRDVSGNVFLTQ